MKLVWPRLTLLCGLASMLAASSCEPTTDGDAETSSRTEDLSKGEVPKGGRPKGPKDDGKGKLSPPIVGAPLYECGAAVSVKGFVPGAKIAVYVDGTTQIAGGISETPWGQSFAVSPLTTGQSITATQTFGGVTSAHSSPIAVTSYFAEHPEGLRKPKVDSPAYECGGAVDVRNLVEGGLLSVAADEFPVGQVEGCGAGQWTFVTPKFYEGQRVTATEKLCGFTSPTSDPVIVHPAPLMLQKLTVRPVYEGGKYVDVWGITNGATVAVKDGSTTIAGHACSGGGQVFRLDPIPAVGATLSATQALCSTVSEPGYPVTVQPCSALPAPKLAPSCLGGPTVTVVGHAPDARIRVYAGAELVADGGGPVLNLLRPLVDGDVLTLTQSLTSCTSPPSQPFVVGQVCSIPPFEQPFWNDDWGVRLKNNCYNYSNNKRTDTFARPGRAAGITLVAPGPDMQCDRVSEAAAADGLLPVARDGKCPCEKTKMALVVAPDVDFHWYRRDSDGGWSQKIGGGPAISFDNSGVVISDPELADRGKYTDFCGYFCSCSDREQGAGHENIE